MSPVPSSGSGPRRRRWYRPPARDQRLLPGRAMGGEIGLAHGEVGAAEAAGRLGVDHLHQRQVVGLVKHLEPGERAGHQPRAVTVPLAADDLLLLRPAEGVVEMPDQPDVGQHRPGRRSPRACSSPCRARRRAPWAARRAGPPGGACPPPAAAPRARAYRRHDLPAFSPRPRSSLARCPDRSCQFRWSGAPSISLTVCRIYHKILFMNVFICLADSTISRSRILP